MVAIARLQDRVIGEDLTRSSSAELQPQTLASTARRFRAPSGKQEECLQREDAISTLGLSGPEAGSSLKAASAERIAIIEPRVFLRECIRRGLETKFSHACETYADLEEFERDPRLESTRLILLCCSGTNDLGSGRGRESIERLTTLAPHAPVVVVAARQNPELMRLALATGAKGYISMSMGFDLAVEAVRFVLAGGSYVPVELFVRAETACAAPVRPDRLVMTAREMLVLRAIKQGKPNKVIAYELNMCESTTKVHVRNIMKKMGAKNRTAVAMKADALLD